MLECQYLAQALAAARQIWEPEALSAMASVSTPDRILGRRRALLLADMHYLWARWFATGIVDPRQFERAPSVIYPNIYKSTSDFVALHFTHLTSTERYEVAQVIARHVYRSAVALRDSRSRQTIPRETRHLMLDLSGSRPSCWICGRAFIPVAIDNFLNTTSFPIPRPIVFDILRPAGLNARDLQIEVDHVMPLSEGGGEGDNLKLACGWCNGHKRAWTTLYQASGADIPAKHARSPVRSLPQPFWVVRLLGTMRKCEHHTGCGKSSAESELTVAPLNRDGAMNPTNLMVTCYEHDPIARIRLVSFKVATATWGK